MTLGGIDTLAALQTPEYAALQAKPTVWSARMRTGFRSFLRMPRRRPASEGAGSRRAAT
ncbi:hypothetical protein [Mangrovicoccus ximenensis]|uniref:hypothetical protein n=1 Tax=Mangrovicoccus ximenensis TaxID=1911570 RepID=UPI001374CA85|nr:hypothetical protein [Mangrovicoccus ximenensis]